MMVFILAVVIVILAVTAFDFAALRWGVDRRERYDSDECEREQSWWSGKGYTPPFD
jgi:hypothetical protein